MRSCGRGARSWSRVSRSGWCASCSNGAWRARQRLSVRRCWPALLLRRGRCCPASSPRSLLAIFRSRYCTACTGWWLTWRIVGPLLIAVDDAHWADEPSLRWLAYLAPRLEGLAAGLLVALRQGDPAAMEAPLLAVRAKAAAVLRPALLSETAVSAVVRAAAGGAATDELCAAVYAACGGNPLYLTELLRTAERHGRPLAALGPGELLAGGLEGIARAVIARVRGLGAEALGLAQALAVLGDGCELRHAAGIAGTEMGSAARLAEGLVRVEVLTADDPPRFVHPVIRAALDASLGGSERDRAHRCAARLLYADGAPPGQVAAHRGRGPADRRWLGAGAFAAGGAGGGG